MRMHLRSYAYAKFKVSAKADSFREITEKIKL